MTTIARGVRGDRSPREQGVLGDRSPGPAQIAALIDEAPTPRPTLLRTFNAMMAREFRVLRRNAIATFTRAVMQPLLFVFVFAYVFPKIGGGFNLGGAATAGAGAAAGLSVLDATQLKPSLETVFLTLTGREYRE